MREIKGIGISEGIAMGKVRFLGAAKAPAAGHAGSAEEEYNRYLKALDETDSQLEKLYLKAQQTAGNEQAEIFAIHRMMLGDPEFGEIVKQVTSGGRTAEYAVSVAAKQLSMRLEKMSDDYMRARAADVLDAARSLQNTLSGSGEINIELPAVIAAKELMPSDTVRIDRSVILGFVTNRGSVNSHMAILARSMQIPALVCDVDLSEINGSFCIVDGGTGKLIIDPTPYVTASYNIMQEEMKKTRERLKKLINAPSVTKNGARFSIFANIASSADALDAKKQGAEGIGLFRSEFLYIGKTAPPTEGEQFEHYRSVLNSFPDSTVIIRTFDIGADKRADYLRMLNEENPALGFRGIRLFLKREELAVTQFCAILRAAAFGDIRIMLPMITDGQQILDAKKLLQKAKQKLERRGEKFCSDIKLGIMIETPAAALETERMCEYSDFFSIGTNDLIQYTLAADRQNENVAALCNAAHPSVLKLIKISVEAAKKHGKWIGICGEAARDTSLTPFFLSLGVDELSVSPGFITNLRNAAADIDISNADEIIKGYLE